MSIPVASVEAGPFLALAFGPPTSAASYSRPLAHRISEVLPESRLARRRRLESCLNLQAATADAAAWGDVAAECRSVAEMSAAQRPLSGNDWLIAASLARDLGDRDSARRALLASFRSTPNEGWIAERRLPLAYLMRSDPTPDISIAMANDALLLFGTKRGAERLARLYGQRPDMRDYLTSIGETLGAEAKLRFLTEVRKTVRN